MILILNICIALERKIAKDNPNVLDEGTLSVARLMQMARVVVAFAFWEGPLTPQWLESQADVVIETRRAADLLGQRPWTDQKAPPSIPPVVGFM